MKTEGPKVYDCRGGKVLLRGREQKRLGGVYIWKLGRKELRGKKITDYQKTQRKKKNLRIEPRRALMGELLLGRGACLQKRK